VHIEARNRGLAPDKLPPDALLKTHSAEYADTPLVQSGHQMVSAKLSGGGYFTLSNLLKDWADNGYAKAVAAARKLMKDNNVDDGARVAPSAK